MSAPPTYPLERMVSAGVPLPLARWYHLFGSKLRHLSAQDHDRINQIRWYIARFGSL